MCGFFIGLNVHDDDFEEYLFWHCRICCPALSMFQYIQSNHQVPSSQTSESDRMKYGKKFREEVERTFPEWKAQFICYKELKIQLKLIYSRIVAGELFHVNNLKESNGFVQLLDTELNKAITFFYEKEEDYIIRLKELQIRASNLESQAEKLQVQKDILDFRAEMVLLLHYSVLNLTGLRKIVKKHNKTTGTSFQFSSMRRVMQQPAFSTDLLHQLMEQCAAMLNRLFL